MVHLVMVPVAISEPRTFMTAYGEITQHDLSFVAPGESTDGWTERVSVAPSIVPKIQEAIKAGRVVQALVHEEARVGGKRGAWISRTVQRLVD